MKSNKIKIVISSRSFGKIESGALNLLKNKGLEAILNPYDRKMTEEEIINLADGAVGIIAGTEKITKNIISNVPDLKVISRYGVGLDNVDLQAAEEKGVIVYNTPETPALAVAELTLSLILSLLRKTSKADNQIRNNSWNPEMGNLLSNKTVGIMGLGRIGKKVVELLQPFHCKMLAYEIKPDKEFISKFKVDVVTKDELLRKSDLVTIHLPSTEETRLFIGKIEFSMMKKSACLINTSRGDLIDENALYTALKTNEIAGASLDVFEKEPYNGKLIELDNVVLTPHIGSSTIETRKDMDIEAVKNLIKGLQKVKIL